MKYSYNSQEFNDKELEILRNAVDEAQRKKGKFISTPQIQNIIHIKTFKIF